MLTRLYNRLYQWLWCLLPDRCEMPGCCRKGVRGNENRIDGKIVCDYCDYEISRRRQ